MRYLALVASMFLTANLFATTTLRLESDDYTLEAALTGDEGDHSAGVVHAPNAQSGDCHGRYTLDLEGGVLAVEFDGLNGPGSAGGCNNESMEANISMENYGRLLAGEEVEITFTSRFFFNALKNARVKVVAQS